MMALTIFVKIPVYSYQFTESAMPWQLKYFGFEIGTCFFRVNFYVFFLSFWCIDKSLMNVYVSVNLCNQPIRELTENFRQFVNCGQFIFLCMQNTEAWPILVCR